jgi:hypothetical protein
MSVEEKLDRLILLIESQNSILERLSMTLQTTNNQPNLHGVTMRSDTSKIIEEARSKAMARIKSTVSNVNYPSMKGIS